MASSATRELFTHAWSAAHAGPVKLLEGQAQLAMTAADVVLVASGTATLEATLCKRPMVVAYRLSNATAATFRLLGLMKAPYFAQPNLLAGEGVVPELFQEAANGPQLGQAVLDWFEQPKRVAALEERFLGIHQQLRRDASARAAEAVLAIAMRKRGPVAVSGAIDDVASA
jgi:lipid-A-disaccharide synthase